MNIERIKELAKQADLDWHRHWNDEESNRLEKFAALVADAEREAWQFNVQMAVLNERKECAKLCEKNADDETEGDWNSACFDCADRIRARGNLIVLTPNKGE
jgi:hypothetical protein